MTTDTIVTTEIVERRSRRFDPPYATITLFLIIVFWQFSCAYLGVKKFLLPAPYDIAVDIISNWRYFIPHIIASTTIIVAGFFVSVGIGVPIAVLLSYSRILNKSLYPLIVGSQVVPKVAIAPLMLAWFGFGMTPKVIIIVLIAFFPIVVNSVVGLRSTPPQMIYLAQSMGANLNQIFWRFCLPQALPSMLAGMKMAAVLAVIGAVVSEFVGSDAGLGYVILAASSSFDIVRQFSAIVLLSVLGLIFFYLIERLERMVIPWHISLREEH
ncbi:MAG TPA: ABC transporter permease [Rhizobium sp.]